MDQTVLRDGSAIARQDKLTGDVVAPSGSPSSSDPLPRNPTIRSVDSNHALPLYDQVYRSIAEEIHQGRLRPDDRLPSERELCRQFGVSRVTLRRALVRFVSEGALQPSRGRGWFVAAGSLSEPPNSLVSFSEMGRARGLTPSSRTLRRDLRAATLEEADLLMVAPGSELILLDRLRLLDGLPIALTCSLIPLARAPDLATIDLNIQSLYDVLEKHHGIVPTWATYSVTAVPADARQAKLLDVPKGSPLIAAQQTTHDQDNRPVEIGEVCFRPDRYRFRATLVKQRT